ncbi:MAG: prepilin-type N-terminal cleavage/methylation domain-containing protein [Planctomycetaceae bacterium]|nr:prepilin-type N-terminal cleavage/methylation domain-containing protein [Planctomycetaceae bacterium]
MHRNIRGFTLLELMIAIALMLIVMLMLRTMFTSAQAMYMVTARRIETFQAGRVSMDYIEQDLLRARTGTGDDNMQLRSLSEDDLKNPNLPHDKFYTNLSNFESADDGETGKIKEFLSFTGTSTWWDSQSKGYVTGDAIIVYFLRKRPEQPGQPRQDGAYLCRRVIPVRSLAEIVAGAKGGWKGARNIEPRDDEIASFVYSVRVFVDDKAAFQWGAMRSNSVINVFPECRQDTAPHLWKTQKGGGAAGAGGVAAIPGGNKTANGLTVILQRPVDGQCVQMGDFFGSQVANPQRDFISTLAEYPSVVVVELTFIDRTFSRGDETGTYRTFTRAIHCPYAPALRWLDKRDTELAGKLIR